MKNSTKISEYLIKQLYGYGVRHVFGIPGDYILGFYDELNRSKLRLINTCDEQGAGFAADAYARLNGLSAVCVTYCVGGLKVANTTAEAYAEKSPVVIISGAPGMKEREKNPLLHHKVRGFDTQKKVFEQLTVASTVLSEPQTALQEIDRVLYAAVRFKRPVYIELPRDMVSQSGITHHIPQKQYEKSNQKALREALDEAVNMINTSRKPAIIAGVEIHRFGLQNDLLKLIQKTKIPVAATILGKSVISELHPSYLGIYEGAMGRDEVREYIESSDCLIILGAFMTDINLGIFTAHLDPARSIYATSEKTAIRYHTYENIHLQDFFRGLIKAKIHKRNIANISNPKHPVPFVAKPREKITIKRLFQRLNNFLKDDTILIADVGDDLIGSSDLSIHHRTEFLSPAYYTSMGFAIPASVGAQLANPKLRALVLVGDGAFQMTGMELSTVARYKLNPIIVVLNNRGYGTERPMQDGSFNDVLEWQYSLIPKVLGAGRGSVIKTEEELDQALNDAEKHTDGFSILDVHLDPYDISPALQRLTRRLAKKVK
jgi:indolepyruvate decarboxylase